jgi:hypothetical protein
MWIRNAAQGMNLVATVPNLDEIIFTNAQAAGRLLTEAEAGQD